MLSRREFLKGAATVVGSAAAVGLGGLLAACGPNETILAGQGATEVWIFRRRFYPEKITIKIDDTVTFFNKDTEAYTVTSDLGLFDESLEPGGSFSYTFTEHKIYRYRCVSRRGMKGEVFVEPEPDAGCDDCHG